MDLKGDLQNLTSIEKKGLLLGSLGSITGSLLFGLVNAIWLTIKLSDFSNLLWIVFYFPIALIISVFPSMMIGIFLARQIERDQHKGSRYKLKSILRGFIAISAMIIILSGLIGLLVPKMSTNVFISYAVSALIIANLVGVGMSRYLSEYVDKT